MPLSHLPWVQTGRAERDPAGADVAATSPGDVNELQKLIAASGVPDFSLDQRYSVVFVYPGIGAGDRYPELAGCTAEVCTFADETTEFVKHGFQLVGLSTQPTEPPGDFLTSFPFPIGRIPADASSYLIEIVDKEEDRYALRTSFVIFPDGTGVRIRDIKDPVGHVQKCFQVAIGRRLHEYQKATLSYLQRETDSLNSSLEHTGFLANGADSVSISTVDLQKKVVAKMASPDIVAQEGGYMDRINRLLDENSRPRVFPAVIAVCADERPAYYLMEAANPLSLDHLLFQDEAMTELRPDRLHTLSDAIAKLTNLYEITFRKEEPEVARYHYLDRFLAIPERQDFKDTYEFMFGGSPRLDEMLSIQFVIDGDYICHSFQDQMELLKDRIDRLAQPVGSYLHGDVHLKNMLVGEDGRSVVFVDPRIIWDGHDVGDPGYGDPLYDYGTLLHSIHVMSAILRAIDDAETEALLNLEEDLVGGAPSIVVWPGLLHITGSKTVDWFMEWVGRGVPEEVLGANWQARLHVNTANALFGWLKYARAIRTRHAWIAVYASVLYHLEAARRNLESA